MATQLADNAFATLASGLTTGDTTLTFTSGHGARFPAVTAPDVLYCCILNTANVLEEIIITAHTADADSCTITRAAGGTTAKAWNAGDRVEARVSKTALFSLNVASATTATSAGLAAVASTATNAIQIAVSQDNTTGDWMYPVFTTGTGNVPVYLSNIGGLFFAPQKGRLATTEFAGNVDLTSVGVGTNTICTIPLSPDFDIIGSATSIGLYGISFYSTAAYGSGEFYSIAQARINQKGTYTVVHSMHGYASAESTKSKIYVNGTVVSSATVASTAWTEKSTNLALNTDDLVRLDVAGFGGASYRAWVKNFDFRVSYMTTATVVKIAPTPIHF